MFCYCLSLIFCGKSSQLCPQLRGADLVVAETESEANIIRGTALDAIFELQVNQAMAGAWFGVSSNGGIATDCHGFNRFSWGKWR